MNYPFMEGYMPISGSRPRLGHTNRNQSNRGADPNQYSVVVTRSVFSADTLPRRIADRSIKCTVFPLLEILRAPEPDVVAEAARNLYQYALVIFVSPSSVSAFMGYLDAWPTEVAIGLVGQGSARRLRLYGISADTTRLVLPAPGETADSDSLLRQLDLKALKGRRVLIVRSDTGRNNLTHALLANGTVVDHLAAYRRAAPKLDKHRLQKLLHLIWSRNTWLITSAKALSVLREQVCIAAGSDGLVQIRKQALIVGHSRIYAAARQAGFTDITLSDPTDDELLETLLYRRGNFYQR